MFNLKVKYPTVNEEVQIIKGTTSNISGQAGAVLQSEEVLRLQELVRGVPIGQFGPRPVSTASKVAPPSPERYRVGRPPR